MKKIRKFIFLIFAGVIFVMALGFSGCAYEPKKVEGDIWTYYILKSGKIALMGMNPDAVPKDGVLYIPNKIDGREIESFAVSRGKGFYGAWIESMSITNIIKSVVADGVPITYHFWTGGTGRIREFESRNPESMYFSEVLIQHNIIVPDGCRESYITAIEKQKEGLSRRYCVQEKTKAVDWCVDEDGLLKGYFGLESDHYVLPNGIKKIDVLSFGGGGGDPKAITLNDDLEEIADDGLNFGSYREPLEEIIFSESVKYIGARVGPVKKVYLYRNTEIHEKAFWNVEIIYLD